ncbi:hypothetical protein [Bradyrhizobium sp. Ai1a-2]|uniref:hypothetical protein n=1 Tax=Bradyrhizobium sp. Ai1a-2 TaxID=196490 RepID=UPI0004259580|nr:hypothetical protein [Bradyrhizobium sp. Ai1a-2]
MPRELYRTDRAKPATLPRLRRVQARRPARLQHLLVDPDDVRNDPDRRKSIKAAQHYTAFSMRAEALL